MTPPCFPGPPNDGRQTALADSETWVRLHQALEPDLDPRRLSDEQLEDVGVTREQAGHYAAWVGGLIEGLRDPHGRAEDITAYLEELADLAEGEGISGPLR